MISIICSYLYFVYRSIGELPQNLWIALGFIFYTFIPYFLLFNKITKSKSIIKSKYLWLAHGTLILNLLLGLYIFSFRNYSFEEICISLGNSQTLLVILFTILFCLLMTSMSIIEIKRRLEKK